MRDSDICKIVSELRLIDEWNELVGPRVPSEDATARKMRRRELLEMLKEGARLPKASELGRVADA